MGRETEVLEPRAAASGAATPAQEVAATVILPAYNEAEALPQVLAAVGAALGAGAEVIVVDDGSTDQTALVAARYPCRVLRHATNQGKGAAVRTGLLAARGRCVIVMDADGTYPAAALPQMIELLGRYDLVRCVRASGHVNMPLVNRVGNRLFDTVLKVVYGLKGDDHLTGLFGLRREALAAMRLTAEGFDLEVEIGIKARAHRLRAIEVPIVYGARVGEKKLRALADGWYILRRVAALALVYNPTLTFIVPGLLLWAVAAALAVVLSTGPIVTPYLGLSIHSFLVAALGVPLGFQWIMFGVAAGLYGVEVGVAPRGWLVWLSRLRVRASLLLLGLLFAAGGAAWLLVLAVSWLARGQGDFLQTESLVFAGVSALWGTQLVSGALFLSIFAPAVAPAARVGRDAPRAD